MRKLTSAILISVLAALALSLSCGKQEAIPQSDWEAMIAIRAEAAAHHKAKTLYDFQLAVGETPADTAELRQMSEQLFTRKNIDLLQRIEDSFEPGRQETQVRRLRHYLMDGLIDLTLEPERRYAAEIAARPIDLPDGSQISIREIPRVLATESNRDRRELLYNSQLPMLKRLNAVKEFELQKLDSLLMSFHYGSVTSYYQEVRDYDFAQLAVTAREILDQTDSITASALHDRAPDLVGINGQALRVYDIPALWNSPIFSSELTPKVIAATVDSFQRACSVITDTLSGLATYWPSGKNVTSRSATYPISAFDDVRVVTVPSDGILALTNYWHEIGHALNYLHTKQKEFEFIYLGAVAEREMMAFMLEDLLDLPSTFSYVLDVRQRGKTKYGEWQSRYSEAEALLKLFSIRTNCVDFLYEYQYFAGLEDPVATFAESREKLWKHPVSDAERELYLSRLSLFESADYLTARIARANVTSCMNKDAPFFDSEGKQIADFQTDKFRAFLLESWSQGSALTFQSLSEQLKCDILSPDALIARMKAIGSDIFFRLPDHVAQ